MRLRPIMFLCAVASLASTSLASAQVRAAPAPVPREFRAVWVATVGNIDWPSRPGLSTWDQQRELLAILDRAVALRLNAVIFQVRPGADALFASPYEPWSEFITGTQGRAPDPPWDPLAFAVEQAHRRGLELHAWFNPYRARYTADSTTVARTHIVATHPELVRTYGHYLWMDPGDPDVRRRSLRAIVDVVKRYDVDGVHIDDYFYPYPETDASRRPLDFPDSATYARYRKSGGRLARDDWRRDNVDRFVSTLYADVHAAKPWVKVGISPFGIWRPGNPPQIKGFDAYTQLYADSRKWLQRGWLDYLSPQLYWPIAPPDQSFPVLLDWWLAQNTMHRHVWPGLATYRIAEPGPRRITPAEIGAEIDTVRAKGIDRTADDRPPSATVVVSPGSGHVHFSMKVLMTDADSVDEMLLGRYASAALVPASPWLGAATPARPIVSLAHDVATGDLVLSLAPRSVSPAVWLWTVRSLANGQWKTEVLPGWLRTHQLLDAGVATRAVYVTAVSRTGVESASAVATTTPR